MGFEFRILAEGMGNGNTRRDFKDTLTVDPSSNI